MATAATQNVDPTASNLYGNRNVWSNYDYDFATTVNDHCAGGSGKNQSDLALSLLRMASTAPLCFVLHIDGDPDYLYVAHSLTDYPSIIGDTSPYDDHVVMLVGNDLTSATPVVLPRSVFQRVHGLHAYNQAYIEGANGLTNPTGAVSRFDRVAAATNDTTEVSVRRFGLVPPYLNTAALSTSATGQYSFPAFYANFIGPELTAGGDRAAAVEHLAYFYQAAMMKTTGSDNSAVVVTPATSGSPVHNRALASCVSKIRENHMMHLGVGGPNLSNAVFRVGVQNITDTLDATTDRTLNYQRDRDQKTFTDKYGDAIAQIMYNLTGATDDGQLPELHQLLAKANKAQFYAILQRSVDNRALASSVPLSEGNLPRVTTKLADEVFRSFQPTTSGIEFARGLSPFSMVCLGHAEADAVTKLLKKAEMAERGNSLGLADAELLTATDVLFPTTPQVAGEKLYAFSVFIDLFHGENTVIAHNVRAAVLRVGPALHSVYNQAGTPKTGMDLVNRVLFDIQQDYFYWCGQAARNDNPATRPIEPTFQKVIMAVQSHRTDSLSRLPALWYTYIEPEPTRRATNESDNRDSNRDTRSRSGSTAVFNTHADLTILRRFRESGKATISAMMEGHNVSIPKQGDQNVCLVWACKGECSENCKRKKMHKRYTAATNKAIHEMMTKCGVAGSQD